MWARCPVDGTADYGRRRYGYLGCVAQEQRGRVSVVDKLMYVEEGLVQEPGKVIELLDEYIECATRVDNAVRQYRSEYVRRANSGGVTYLGSGPNDAKSFRALPDEQRIGVLELEAPVRRVLEACDEKLLEAFEATWNMRERADIVRQAISAIRTQEELDGWLGPKSPAADPRGLHPVVAGPATVYWDAAQYRVAVDEAARAVNVHLQTALGRRNLDNTDLARQAFSVKPPSEDQPRLRFPELDKAVEERTWTSRHQGAMEFAAGLFQAVRNITAHADPNGAELAPEYALDCLSSFSLLARWIDEAERRETGD
ncbi:MAG: TIGR02391 family protein [Roseovarius sp.]|nr:TIGR02391 family protein [Roseovarius sp.]